MFANFVQIQHTTLLGSEMCLTSVHCSGECTTALLWTTRMNMILFDWCIVKCEWYGRVWLDPGVWSWYGVNSVTSRPKLLWQRERPSERKMVARDHLCQSNVFHPPCTHNHPPTSYKRDLTGAQRHSVVEEAYQAVAVTQLLIRSSSDHLCLTNWPQWDNF